MEPSADRELEAWSGRESIYDLLLRHLDPSSGHRPGDRIELPAEAGDDDDDELEFAAGALDGLAGSYGETDDDEEQAAALAQAIQLAAQQPSPDSTAALGQLLASADLLYAVDPVLEQLAAEQGCDADRLLDLAKWLATRSPECDPVKLGMALFGLVCDDEALGILQVLGRHDEFTLYAAVAITNSVEDPDALLWKLAQGVVGWGRIQTIERLKHTTDPEIQRWLLREGYQNSVLMHYTALICAETGGLLECLRGEPDDREFRGAGMILSTLITGKQGPAEDLDDYAAGVEAVGLYVQRFPDRERELQDLLVISTIHDALVLQDAQGTSSSGRSELRSRCAAILADARWRDRAQQGLQDPDHESFHLAARAAQALGMDPWEPTFERLTLDPNAATDLLFDLCQTEDPERMGRVVAFASKALPLEQIASGPGTELGMGKEFADDFDLCTLLQFLGRFPGLGWNLIRAGLSSPVVRSRYMAVEALESWGASEWNPEVRPALEAALAAEPDEDVRHDIELLLGEDSTGGGAS